MSDIHLEIITPEKIAFTDTVDMVTVPSAMGTMGVLHNHVPLFAQLVQGELKIKKGNEEYFLSIGGGFIQITKDKVMILVTRAVHASDLNEQEIIKAKQSALDALKSKPSGEAMALAATLYRQSLVDLAILRKRKKGLSH
jgi:F-type H+-transporting ATPase subunit epsilon